MGRIDQVRDFQNFKFDTEPSFNEWIKTLEITNDSPATQLRLRGKWYKKTIDVNFDLAWLAGLPTEQTTSSARSSQPSYTAPPQTQTQRPSSGPSYAPPPSQPAGGRGAYPVGTRIELYIFMYHVLLLILAVLHLVPLLPALSARSYKMFMQIAIVGQALKLFTTYSPSALRPFSWANAQRYLATIAPTSEFHFLIVAVAFSNHTPIALAMFPLAIPALYSVMTRLQATHGQHVLWQRFGAKAFQVLQAKQREAQMMAAWSELAVGAVLLLTLFTRNRNIMLTFAYANLLKMRYHLGDCAAQHRAAWATVAQKTAGIRARAPPLVNQLLQYPINWFMSVR